MTLIFVYLCYCTCYWHFDQEIIRLCTHCWLSTITVTVGAGNWPGLSWFYNITSYHTYTAFFTGNEYGFGDNDRIPSHYASYDTSAGDRRAVSYWVFGNFDVDTCTRLNSGLQNTLFNILILNTVNPYHQNILGLKYHPQSGS